MRNVNLILDVIGLIAIIPSTIAWLFFDVEVIDYGALLIIVFIYFVRDLNISLSERKVDRS